MSEPVWTLARVGALCGSCRTRIPPATPVRRVADGLRLRCVPCAKKLLNEDPPPGLLLDVPPPPPPAKPNGQPGPLQPFVELFRARLLGVDDVKRRASGDR